MKNESNKFLTREGFSLFLEEDRRRWEAHAAEDRKRWDDHLRRWDEHLRKWDEHLAEDRKKWDEHIAEDRRKWEEHIAEDRQRWEEHIAEDRQRWEEHLRKWDEHVAEDRQKWEEHLRKWDKHVAEDRRKWEENQKKWEENQKVIHRMLAQLSRHGDFIGFGVEGLAAVLLPHYLENTHNLRIKQLKKEVIPVNGKQIEVNLFGSGRIGRKKVAVLVECKSTIGKKSIEGFLKKLRVIEPYLRSQGREVIRIVFGPLILPEAAMLARKEGIEMVSSVPQSV